MSEFMQFYLVGFSLVWLLLSVTYLLILCGKIDALHKTMPEQTKIVVVFSFIPVVNVCMLGFAAGWFVAYLVDKMYWRG